MNRRQQIIKLALQVLAYVLPRVPAHNMEQLTDLSLVTEIIDTVEQPTATELLQLRNDFESRHDEPEDETLRLLTQSVDTFLAHCDAADPDYEKTLQLRTLLVTTSDSLTAATTGDPGDNNTV